jgi:radical SAM-linked protein
VRDQPEQQAPPVQRLRIRYAKRGRLRFTSHRDFSRAFERAIFRARVPMAYSSGFNPHPRISYAGAAPTGSASEAEYLEIALAEVVDPAAVRVQLEDSLPDGLDVLEVVESPGGSLSDRLEASHWLLDLDAPAEAASAAVAAFLGTGEVLVERMTKKGMRRFDCRAAVVALAARRPSRRRALGPRRRRRPRSGWCDPAHPARPGSARPGVGGGRRPAACPGVRVPRGSCAILAVVAPGSRPGRPDDVLAGPSWPGTPDDTSVARPRRGPAGR